MPETRREKTADFRHFRVLRILLLALFVSWLLSLFYLFTFDSSSNFVVRLVREQDAWSAHFTPDQGPRLVVTGGSSCAFSIDAGAATEQFHLPVINAGLEAAMGSYGIILETSRLLRRGDTLVVALEPSLFNSALGYTHDSLQIFIRQFAWSRVFQAKEITGRSVPLDRLLLSPQPGLENFAAFLGRTVTATPFRYDSAQIKPGGLMMTDYRTQLDESGEHAAISPNNRKMLFQLRAWASKKGVRLVYSVPWLMVADERAHGQKKDYALFVAEMLEIMPVVHDETFGVHTDRSLFADTPWHLTEQAAQVRTSELMKQILANDLWTADRLAQVESGL